MTTGYEATVQAVTKTAEPVSVSSFTLFEAYSGGWYGAVDIVSRRSSRSSSYVTLGGMLSDMLDVGLAPGNVANLSMTANGDAAVGVVRNWPLVITKVTPGEMPSPRQKKCRLEFVDPVSALASREFWGAYSDFSLGEMIGGALSSVAGSGGLPVLNPVLPGMPLLRISEEVRSALQQVPYAVGVGHKLSRWLEELLGRVGVRYELFGQLDGSLDMRLADGAITEEPIAMTLVTEDALRSGLRNAVSEEAGYIDAASVKAIPPYRPALLDDALYGPAVPIAGRGAMEGVQEATGVDSQESVFRASLRFRRDQAEGTQMTFLSSQFDFRPGRSMQPDQQLYGVDVWQISRVAHAYRSSRYLNSATLLRVDAPWYPLLTPGGTEPVVVSAVVTSPDGDRAGLGGALGGTYEDDDPVYFDAYGRVYVQFPYHVQAVEKAERREAREAGLKDLDYDGRATESEFSDEEKRHFSNSDTESLLEDELLSYDSGAYDDPYPGRSDHELSSEELGSRNALLEKRIELERYKLYKSSKIVVQGDLDGDGRATQLEGLVGTDVYNKLARELVDTGQVYDNDPDFTKEVLKKLSSERGNYAGYVSRWDGRVRRYKADNETIVDDVPFRWGDMWDEVYGDLVEQERVTPPMDSELEAVNESFEPAPTEDTTEPGDDDTESVFTDKDLALLPGMDLVWAALSKADREVIKLEIELRLQEAREFVDAYRELEKVFEADTEELELVDNWPAKVPLRCVSPVAGRMHGLTLPPRKDDACRIAVYHPMHAEIMGFTHRRDRGIGRPYEEYFTGFFVGHNSIKSWSGLAARPVELFDFRTAGQSNNFWSDPFIRSMSWLSDGTGSDVAFNTSTDLGERKAGELLTEEDFRNQVKEEEEERGRLEERKRDRWEDVGSQADRTNQDVVELDGEPESTDGSGGGGYSEGEGDEG